MSKSAITAYLFTCDACDATSLTTSPDDLPFDWFTGTVQINGLEPQNWSACRHAHVKNAVGAVIDNARRELYRKRMEEAEAESTEDTAQEALELEELPLEDVSAEA